MNAILMKLDDEAETMKILNKIIVNIDSAIENVKHSEPKYGSMDLSQIAALTAFEEELKRIYFATK